MLDTSSITSSKIIKKTIHKGLWLNKKGISTTLHLDNNRIGNRISILETEDGVIAITHLKGDGRFPNAHTLYGELTTTDSEKAIAFITKEIG